MRRIFVTAVVLALLAALRAVHAGETTVQKETKPAAESKPRFTIYGWIEGGFTGNPDGPEDNQNFSRLFDDRSNEPLLNQASITAERTLDSSATGFDWGF